MCELVDEYGEKLAVCRSDAGHHLRQTERPRKGHRYIRKSVEAKSVPLVLRSSIYINLASQGGSGQTFDVTGNQSKFCLAHA